MTHPKPRFSDLVEVTAEESGDVLIRLKPEAVHPVRVALTQCFCAGARAASTDTIRGFFAERLDKLLARAQVNGRVG